MLMLIIIVLGLCLGSFINAWVWRVYKQQNARSVKTKSKYSLLHGRSMCVDCGHELSPIDLVPLLSWLSLRGKCRYCKAKISWQYPAVELLTTLLFVISYLSWGPITGAWPLITLGLWLFQLTCLIALSVYDIRWYILPNKMLLPLALAVALELTAYGIQGALDTVVVVNLLLSTAIAGGIFWVIFQISKGKWIGGGDVKLGALLGLILGRPDQSFLLLFLASLLGVLAALPALSFKKLTIKQQLPFGPFLVLATIITKLAGADMIHWYLRVAGL